jgi:hypothetical protein
MHVDDDRMTRPAGSHGTLLDRQRSIGALLDRAGSIRYARLTPGPRVKILPASAGCADARRGDLFFVLGLDPIADRRTAGSTFRRSVRCAPLRRLRDDGAAASAAWANGDANRTVLIGMMSVFARARLAPPGGWEWQTQAH